MKRSLTRPTRGIWSEKENHTLIRLAQDKAQSSWNEIAIKLNSICGGTKSGKQCRERYRNYANPKLEKTEWKPHEKLLFIVLHQVHGNRWSEIAKYLNWRSDVVIKNYFYCVIRKATKHLSTQVIPRSFLKTPEKFYMIFSVLRYIKEHYLPDVKNLHRLPKYGQKEHMILNLLSERKITEESIDVYHRLMITSFKQNFPTNKLPVKLSLSLERFKAPESRIKELKEAQHLFNKKPLNQLVLIEVNETSEEIKPIPLISLSNLKSSVSSEPSAGNVDYYTNWNSLHTPSPYDQSSLIKPSIHSQREINKCNVFPLNNFYTGNYFPRPLVESPYMGLMTPPMMALPFLNQQVVPNGQNRPFGFVIRDIETQEHKKLYGSGVYKP